MLLFKKKFLEAIRQGEKTQTIRLWKHCRMRAGQRSYIPGVGYIRVETVEPVLLDQLDDRDAQPDGFATADLLRREIAQLYGDVGAEGYGAYRIVFRVLDAEEQAACCQQRRERKSAVKDSPRGARAADA
ncbi:MAG TPA: ASCH domain-containing protein [Pirellulales bacterium]